MAEEKLEILPPIPPMPTPPKDSGDADAWQKHIAAIDQYIDKLNIAIEKIENNQFIENFKQKCEELGVNIDQSSALPKDDMARIADQVNGILDRVREMSVDLGVEASAQQQHHIIKTRRDIQSI